MQLLWLADALRAGGLKVIEVPGWRVAGHGPMVAVRGVLGHHTAGPRLGNSPSLSVVVQGRSNLAGPLANLYLDRAGAWYPVAAGFGYHAGVGSLPWCPKDDGNRYLIGIEAESCGEAPWDWTKAQLESYPRGVAALLRHEGLSADRFAGHKEYTSRKIDPAGWPGDMAGFRVSVQHWLLFPTPPKPRPKDDDTMYIKSGPPPNPKLAILSGPIFQQLLTAGERASAEDAIQRQGAPVQFVESVTWNQLVEVSNRLCGEPKP